MYRSQHKKRGFTLLEMVVVIADLALLASIIVPIVGRVIDNAKSSRAQNDCLMIAAAIQKFYGDVGVFPASDFNISGDTQPNYVTNLVGSLTWGAPSPYGYTGSSNIAWYDGGNDMSVAAQPFPVTTFDEHLNQNRPGFSSGSAGAYPSTGSNKWNGPYLAPITSDPWGHPYVCNIGAACTGSNTLCVVLSAGPNGSFDTSVNPAATVAAPTGDDIWAIVASRR